MAELFDMAYLFLIKICVDEMLSRSIIGAGLVNYPL